MNSARQPVAELIQSCTNFLRGKYSSSEYSGIILVVLFLRIADTIKNSNRKEKLPYWFQEKSARFSVLDIGAPNFSEQLSTFGRSIERQFSPNLDGVFDTALKFANTEEADNLLRKIWFSVSGYLDSYDDFEALGDLFSAAVDYLTETNAIFGSRSLPADVANLISSLVDVADNEKIYDPACGTGSLLLSCIKKNARSNCGYASGREENLTAFRLANLNFIANLVEPSNVFRADAELLEYADSTAKTEYNVVVSIPPWGHKLSSRDRFEKKYLNGSDSISHLKLNYESIIIFHVLDSLKKTGRAILAFPTGVLFRTGSDSYVRKTLIDSNLLDGIILLPQRTFPLTAISVALLIIKKDRDDERIIFIDVEEDEMPRKGRFQINGEKTSKIIRTIKERNVLDGFSALVTRTEIASNNYDLSVRRYVEKALPESDSDINSLLERRDTLAQEIAKIETEISDLLSSLGTSKAGPPSIR